MNEILIVEDDILLSEMMEEFLADFGFKTTVCEDANTAIDLAYNNNFDLWILDVKIKGGDGFSLLKQLRSANKSTPAIFTTSLNTLEDLELGFKSGCDDYLKKPFELKELLIRIKSILKRQYSHKFEEFEYFDNGLKFSISSKILYKENKIIPLTKKETSLLSLFLKNKNKFLTSEIIFNSLWNYDKDPSQMSLRAYVKRLRQILGKDKIITQRGNGYMYVQ